MARRKRQLKSKRRLGSLTREHTGRAYTAHAELLEAIDDGHSAMYQGDCRGAAAAIIAANQAIGVLESEVAGASMMETWARNPVVPKLPQLNARFIRFCVRPTTLRTTVVDR